MDDDGNDVFDTDDNDETLLYSDIDFDEIETKSESISKISDIFSSRDFFFDDITKVYINTDIKVDSNITDSIRIDKNSDCN